VIKSVTLHREKECNNIIKRDALKNIYAMKNEEIVNLCSEGLVIYLELVSLFFCGNKKSECNFIFCGYLELYFI